MSAYGIIILILLYLQSQALAADNTSTEIDKMINASLKTSIEPCDDFYYYACGNYNEQTIFNASLTNKNFLNYANYQYNTEIVKLLGTYDRQKYQIGEGCQTLDEKVRNYFLSCGKVTKRNLTRYLEEMKPGPDLNWPVLESDSSQINQWPHGKDFDVLYILGKLEALGISNVILKSSAVHGKDGDFILLQAFTNIYPTMLPNITTMLNMLSLMGVENSTQLLEDVLDIEDKLRDILPSPTGKQDGLVISLADLVKRYPNLNFQTYFVERMGRQWPLNTSIALRNPSYFQALNDKIGSVFPKLNLCSFIMMHYLSWFDATTELNSVLCVEELRLMAETVINFLYYQYHSDNLEKIVKPDVMEIFKTVVHMVETQFRRHDLKLARFQLEWLRMKLPSIQLNIGNLPHNTSCANFAQIYSVMPPMDENNYYKNHLIMLRLSRSEEHASYFGAAKPLITADATVTLNFAYLVPPVYDFHYNSLSKYAILGFILAREVVLHCKIQTFAFQFTYRQPTPLASAFECLNISSPDDVCYGCIADNVASEVIRKIVTLRVFNLKPIDSVPAWKKHFYLNVAQHYCSAGHSETDIERLSQIVKNSEGFSQAFNCSEGSKMNPSKKCQI